jgi:hypothetical protein
LTRRKDECSIGISPFFNKPHKDPERDLELTLDFGTAKNGTVETETLHGPAIDAREAQHGALKQGQHTAIVPHASEMRVTVR